MQKNRAAAILYGRAYAAISEAIIFYESDLEIGQIAVASDAQFLVQSVFAIN